VRVKAYTIREVRIGVCFATVKIGVGWLIVRGGCRNDRINTVGRGEYSQTSRIDAANAPTAWHEGHEAHEEHEEEEHKENPIIFLSS
jgi:hypothetical protein